MIFFEKQLRYLRKLLQTLHGSQLIATEIQHLHLLQIRLGDLASGAFACGFQNIWLIEPHTNRILNDLCKFRGIKFGVVFDCALRQRLLQFINLSLGEVGVVVEKQLL